MTVTSTVETSENATQKAVAANSTKSERMILLIAMYDSLIKGRENFESNKKKLLEKMVQLNLIAMKKPAADLGSNLMPCFSLVSRKLEKLKADREECNRDFQAAILSGNLIQGKPLPQSISEEIRQNAGNFADEMAKYPVESTEEQKAEIELKIKESEAAGKKFLIRSETALRLIEALLNYHRAKCAAKSVEDIKSTNV